MSKIGGICYIKVDGEQLDLTGGIETPLNKKIKEGVATLSGGVNHTEKYRVPYIKGTFAITKDFPIDKIFDSDDMTVTAELANGLVYVLSNAFVAGESNYNAEEGTAELEFNGEGFYQ